MDFLSTKGTEYLLLIGYLLLLIPFFMALREPRRKAAPAYAAASASNWFELPQDRHYHRGHTWAQSHGGGVFRLGIDDFASKLVGRPDLVDLPQVGAELTAGDRGFVLRAGGRGVSLLSPVAGEVIAVNPAIAADPGLVADDPYGEGWLLEMRVPKPRAAMKNLLPQSLAAAWAERDFGRVLGKMGGDLGVVLQDGGMPVSGIARQLSPEHWPEIAAEMLMTAAPDA